MKPVETEVCYWKDLLGERATNSLFAHFANGLGEDSQIYAVFSSYELNPELFRLRLSSIGIPKKDAIYCLLEIARSYALFREKAFQESQKTLNPSRTFERDLLNTIPPDFRLEPREWIGFWAQYRQGHWSKLEWIERGVRTHVNFDASEFFARLLAFRPKAFVLVHNHPSGITQPSWIDYQLTKKLGALARQFGIELKGHWVVGPHSEDWIPFPNNQEIS